MTPESGSTGGPMLQECPACGVSFDMDVPRCPDCGQRVGVSRTRTVTIVIAVLITLAVLVALWASGITPISPDF